MMLPIIAAPVGAYVASHMAAQRIRENMNGGGHHHRHDDDDEHEHFVHPEHECMECVYIDDGNHKLVDGELKYWCNLRKEYCASWFDKSYIKGVSFYTEECAEGRADRERREWEMLKAFFKAFLVIVLAVTVVLSTVFYFMDRDDPKDKPKTQEVQKKQPHILF